MHLFNYKIELDSRKQLTTNTPQYKPTRKFEVKKNVSGIGLHFFIKDRYMYIAGFIYIFKQVSLNDNFQRYSLNFSEY